MYFNILSEVLLDSCLLIFKIPLLAHCKIKCYDFTTVMYNIKLNV